MRRRNKEQTRQEILEATITLFSHKGLINTSTLQIADRAGVAHGTVFFHFPTRHELIIAAIYCAMGDLARKLDEKSRSTDNLKALCEIFIEEVDKNSRFYSSIVRDLPQLPLDVQRMVFAALSAFSANFVDVIKKKQKAGKVRKFPPKLAVFYWFGLIHYIYSYPELLSSHELFQKHKKELIKLFIKSLK